MLLVDTLGRASPAVRSGPEMAAVRALLGTQLETVAVSVANDTVLAVLRCLAHDDAVPAQAVAPSYLALLGAHPAAAALRSPAESVVTDALRDLLAYPLSAPLLPRIIVGSRDGEQLFTRMRTALLQRALDPAFLGQTWLWQGVALVGAAALNGEYAWAESADDAAMITAMTEAVNASLAGTVRDETLGALAPVLLTLAMYRRLSTITGWERLVLHAERTWGPFAPLLQPVLHRHVRQRLDERQRALALPTLDGGISTDDGSRRVRAQYEAHPYPRWITPPTARVTSLAALARELRPHAPPPTSQRILIAGCGTGRQIVHLATSFPDARITAFDLSLASLGYAARMLDELRVPSITLMQGDLLRVGALGERFALISCSGVLHHLADPRAGWRGLVACLEPQGLMKIGLYSTHARATVRAARAVVAREGLPDTDGALRAARQQLLALPADHPAVPATDSLDFYSLSGFRDLVVHVQERTYTIPELAAELEALDLEFLGFQLPRHVQSRFLAEYPSGWRDLAAWDAFERRHPLTFWEMYQFWCGRRGD